VNEWEASCYRKVRYATRAIAKRHAKMCDLKGLRQLSPYKCQYCQQWHLGHRAGEATYRRGANGEAVAGTPAASC